MEMFEGVGNVCSARIFLVRWEHEKLAQTVRTKRERKKKHQNSTIY